MTTKELINGELIEIDWEKLDFQDDAGDGHVFMYGAKGQSDDGRTWGGTWVDCDHMVEITDIEEE